MPSPRTHRNKEVGQVASPANPGGQLLRLQWQQGHPGCRLMWPEQARAWVASLSGWLRCGCVRFRSVPTQPKMPSFSLGVSRRQQPTPLGGECGLGFLGFWDLRGTAKSRLENFNEVEGTGHGVQTAAQEMSFPHILAHLRGCWSWSAKPSHELSTFEWFPAHCGEKGMMLTGISMWT